MNRRYWIEGFAPKRLEVQTLFERKSLEENSQIDTPQLVGEGTILHLNHYASSFDAGNADVK